jgi:3-phosphoshikimate 1-carboxyvinyltransferase
MIQKVFPGNYSGKIQIPASKSDGQRALLCAALAKGRSRIYFLGKSKDELAMLRCVEQLGAKITWKGKVLEVEGIQHFPRSVTLNCGESGLSSRLLIAICAMYSGDYHLTGEGSLLNRSMEFYETLFEEQNIQHTFSSQNRLPMHIQGAMQAGTIKVDGSQSSQYISGLLMGLPLLPADSTLIVENGVSLPYIYMTINILESFGVTVAQEGNRYLIPGNQSYQPVNYIVEGDWSSASYWLVASALGQDIHVKGLSFESLQADKAILEAFENASCVVRNEENELQIDGTNRQSFEFDATNCPDLFPALVTFASLTSGVSVITGVNRLKNKESDRGTVLQEEFGKLGVTIEIIEDEMHVIGKSAVSGGVVNTHNDHRIAMCFGILGMFSISPIIIEGAEAVEKSYPRFWEEVKGKRTENII